MNSQALSYPFFPSELVLRLRHCIASGNVLLRKDSVLILVCGARSNQDHPTGRDNLIHHARRHWPGFRFFEAEQVFIALAKESRLDLLSIEDRLSRFSDCVILVLESPGTLAEVGAFAIKDEIAKLCLVVNDSTYKNDNSFINFGPLAKIGKISDFGQPIYTDLTRILIAAPDVLARLNKIARQRGRRVGFRDRAAFTAQTPKLRMLLLADIIALFSPLTFNELIQLLNTLLGPDDHWDIDIELGMLHALRLIERTDGMFCRSLEDRGLFYEFQTVNESTFRLELVTYYKRHSPNRTTLLQRRAIQT